MSVSFEEVVGLWRDGQRRLEVSEAAQRPALERIVDELVVELRRRLGGSFTAEELATLYIEQGTDWCFDIAARVAPRDPSTWDVTTVGGAAFARYLREASDFGGGRRRVQRD